MKRMKIFLFCAAIALCRVYLVCGGPCDAETLSTFDESFCHGELEVIYPDLEISTCDVIPPKLRDMIRLTWGAPRVRLAHADEAGPAEREPGERDAFSVTSHSDGPGSSSHHSALLEVLSQC